MNAPLDRRAFLVRAGAGGFSLALGAAPSVAAGRRRRGPGSPVPRTFQAAMRGHVFNRGDPGFAAVSHVYNQRFDWVVPKAVGRPIDTQDVQGAVRWAVGHGVSLRARSGGHSYAGYSTVPGGAVLDLRKLNQISINRRAGTATIGAGAQLIDVYAGLAAHGATIPAGSCPSVGIAGVTLGGGMGLAGRKFGLTTDNLVAAEIVTADGHIRQVNARTNPDLLWALRGGGGGNFGIVTKFTFRIHRMPATAAYFFVSWPWSSAADALGAWLSWAPHARDELTSIFHLNAGGGSTSVNVAGQYFGPSSDLGSLLAPLRNVAGAGVSTGDQGYLSLQLRWAGCSSIGLPACHTVGTSPHGTLPRESFQAKSDYLDRQLSSSVRQMLVNAMAARAGQPGNGNILFDSYGGAINHVAPHATAFVHRRALCAMQYLTYNGDATWLDNTYASMRPHVSGLAYQNYIDRSLSRWRQAYYGSNYHRLVQVQQSVDPHHFFTFPQAIGR